LTTDQRGFTRPVDAANSPNGTGNLADIGAFEVQNPAKAFRKSFFQFSESRRCCACRAGARLKIFIFGWHLTVNQIIKRVGILRLVGDEQFLELAKAFLRVQRRFIELSGLFFKRLTVESFHLRSNYCFPLLNITELRLSKIGA